MPVLSDEEKDQKLNPGQSDYDRRFNDIAKAETDGTFNDIANNFDKTADGSKEDENIEKLRNREGGGDTGSRTWANNTSENQDKTKGRFWTKKKVGVFGGGGIGALLISLFFGSIFAPAGLLLNLGEVATSNRDTQNTILNTRLFKVIDNKMVGATTNGSCSFVKAACRFSNVSKPFLAELSERRISAVDANGSVIPFEGKGYPDKQPTKYIFTSADGSTIDISPQDFTKTLRNNADFRKAFTNAFNTRWFGWNDNWIKKLYYKAVGVVRDGKNLADIDPANPNELTRTIAEGADADNGVKKIPDTDVDAKNRAATNLVTEAVTDELNKSAKKLGKTGGDPLLMVGMLGCIGLNAPGFITNVVRVYQMRQLIVLAANIVLTSQGMLKAGDMSPEVMAGLGAALTATTLLPDGTKTKSAMDSLGIRNILFNDTNTSSSTSYKKFIPGGASIAAVAPIAEFANDPAVRESCEAIASPQAEIAVNGIWAGIGAASGGVGLVVKAVTKVVGSVILSEAALELLMPFVGNIVSDVIGRIPPEDIAAVLANKDVEGAQGEERGDALGAGLNYFYSQGALSSGSAPMTTSQIVAFDQLTEEVTIAYAEQDRVGRSPFDVSSPYTFLGSIVKNYSQFALSTQNPVKSAFSAIGYTLQQPLSLLTKNTSAATSDMAERCSFAEDHNLTSDVGIGIFGEVCPGIPTEYLGVSTAEVLNSVTEDINPNSGAPKDDGEIGLMLGDCGTGNVFSVGGCVIEDQERANQSIYMYDLRISDVLDGVEEGDSESAADGEFVLPVDADYVTTDPWGQLEERFHRGTDFAANGSALGRPVYAVGSGTVITADKSNGSGSTCEGRMKSGGNNIVEIQHDNGLISGYWHMGAGDITVSVGDRVTPGQQIGAINNCGESFGAHLHFIMKPGTYPPEALSGIETNGPYINPGGVLALFGVNI